MQNLDSGVRAVSLTHLLFLPSPNGMETLSQFHFSCLLNKKVLHLMQLLHWATLKSLWVMKDKLGIALKNQFIFNVVTSPLNTVVRIFMPSMVKFLTTRLQWSLYNLWIQLQIVMHQGSTVTWQNVVIDLFALGIVNFRKLCSVANMLQERCFASVRPADYEDSEVTYAIEVLSDFRRIQLDLSASEKSSHAIYCYLLP